MNKTPKAGGISDKDPVTNTVDFWLPEDKTVVLKPGADPAQAALDWLEAHKAELGIPDARAAYKPLETTKDDEDGMTHVKLQQTAGGLSVEGVETTLTFDETGAVAILDGPYIPNLEAIAKTPPTVDEAKAKGIAETEAKGLITDASAAVQIASELVVYVDDEYGGARLARHITLRVNRAEGSTIEHVFVDALTGDVLDSNPDGGDVETQRETTGQGFDGENHKVLVVDRDGTLAMGRLPTAEKSFLAPGKLELRSDNLYYLNYLIQPTIEGPWDRQAISAMLNVDRAERFYADDLKWKGVNNKLRTVYVAIRSPGDWNAYAYWGWNDEADLLEFTASVDGQRSGVIAIDIVGHEFTHLVTAYTSKLKYVRQPGAINEAMSDIFGELIERKIQGVTDSSFLIGSATGETLRDMRHPTRLEGKRGERPDNLRNVRTLAKGEKPGDKNDVGYVHYNSSIVNNAFALILEGGSNDTSKMGVQKGIGWDKSIKLWWKTQRNFLTKRSTIRRLARGQIAIAKKSKHAFAIDAVACGWAAVDAVKPEWVKEKFDVTCPDAAACTGRENGWYCEIEPDTLTHCSNGKVDDRQTCPAAQCSVSGDRSTSQCKPAQFVDAGNRD